MKITKDILRKNKIFNPYNLAQDAGNKLYINYAPAENGKISHYACWTVTGIGFKTNPQGHWTENYCKTFTVHIREEKPTKLQEAIAWVKEKYDLDCSEKDPFGAYQVVGTMEKIAAKIKNSEVK